MCAIDRDHLQSSAKNGRTERVLTDSRKRQLENSDREREREQKKNIASTLHFWCGVQIFGVAWWCGGVERVIGVASKKLVAECGFLLMHVRANICNIFKMHTSKFSWKTVLLVYRSECFSTTKPITNIWNFQIQRLLRLLLRLFIHALVALSNTTRSASLATVTSVTT